MLMLAVGALSGMGGMPFGMPGAGPAQLNENDFAQMMNAFKELEQNPEQLEAFKQVLNNLPPEAIQAAAEEGQRMLSQMTPEQLNQFADTLKVDPNMLKMSGTPAPMDFPEPAPRRAPEKVESERKPAAPRAQPAKMGEIKSIISSLINHLESLLQKGNASDFIGYRISSVKRDIALLLYYLKIINKDIHLERLTQAAHEKIYKTVKDLATTVSREEPKITLSQEESEFLSPYDTLGVSFDKIKAYDRSKAFDKSKKVIDAAYHKLIKKHNRHAVKKRLLEVGASDEDIEAQLQLTNLARERIEEAYEAISDPKMREQINRGLTRKDTQSVFGDKQSRRALKEITQAVNTALFASINDNLERFIQQYAPEEMKKKKFLEEAEKTHLEELKWKAFRQPVIAHTGQIEPQVTLPRPAQAPSEGYGYGYPGSQYPAGMYPGAYQQPWAGDRTRPEEKPSKKETPDKEKSKGEKGGEKELTKDEKARQKKAAEKDPRKPEEIIKEMKEQLSKFKGSAAAASTLIEKMVKAETAKPAAEDKTEYKKEELEAAKKKGTEEKEKPAEKEKSEEKSTEVKEPQFGEEPSDVPLYEEIEKQKGHRVRKGRETTEAKESKETSKKKAGTGGAAEKALEEVYEKMQLKQLAENASKLDLKYKYLNKASGDEQLKWTDFSEKFRDIKTIRNHMMNQLQNLTEPPVAVKMREDLQKLHESVQSLDSFFKYAAMPTAEGPKGQAAGLTPQQLQQLQQLQQQMQTQGQMPPVEGQPGLAV